MRHVPRTRRAALGAAAMATLAITATHAAAAAPAAPPDHTYTIHIGVDSIDDPLTPISYEAICWTTAPNTGVTQAIVATLVPEPGAPSYTFAPFPGWPDTNGTEVGQFNFPHDAPEGDYVLTLYCTGPDGLDVGTAQATLTFIRPAPVVDVWPQVPPASVTRPATESTPATPVHGTAAYTG